MLFFWRALFVVFWFPACSVAYAGSPVNVRVVESIIELRSGPAKSHPVITVVSEGQRISILKRRTDWYKVRTVRGVEGWVAKEKFSGTLARAGVARSSRDTVLEDYLKQRAEFGFVWGQFENNPFIGVHGGWRISPDFSLELGYSHVSGKFSNSKITNIGLTSHPFPDWRVSPYFSLGFGRYRNEPIRTLINAPTTSAWAANVSLGARAYMTQNFVVRVYARRYAAFLSNDTNATFVELGLGAGFFF